jgi:hypothetical protein
MEDQMMDPQMLERHFAKIGARAKLRTDPRRSREESMAIDVRADRAGEYFDLLVGPRSTAELAVIDMHPQLRHLVLMSRDDDGKHKFLCGHDERHWFVAAVPESRAVSTVATAIEALKPDGVRWRERRLPLKPRNRYRRRNPVFVRQGEWFFVPMGPRFRVNAGLILQNEPLRRAGGKPHMVEELTRDGGEAVYVCAEYPNGLTPRQYQVLLSRKPTLRGLGWIVQRRNPLVFVRGKVRHADHKTIVLHGWHQVLMNTENQSAAMRHVAFID